jgi:pimeloyl-ACP methyl ester carboxylesterase
MAARINGTGEAAMYHRIDGQGSTVLLLVHGAMCGHRDWEQMTAHLVDEFTVARVDMAGHGLSPGSPDDCSMARWAGDVTALAQQFGSHRVVLVGHSLGARVVSQAAASGENPVAGVVLVDGSCMVYPGGNAGPARQTPGRVDFDELIGPYADAGTRRMIREGIDRAAKPIFAAIADELKAWDHDHADTVYRSLADTPLLAIQSTFHDNATRRYSLQSANETSRYLDYLRAAVPRAEIRVIPQAGHFNMMEKPAEVAEAVADFARRVVPQTAKA